jgi:hypothetical protein
MNRHVLSIAPTAVLGLILVLMVIGGFFRYFNLETFHSLHLHNRLLHIVMSARLRCGPTDPVKLSCSVGDAIIYALIDGYRFIYCSVA